MASWTRAWRPCGFGRTCSRAASTVFDAAARAWGNIDVGSCADMGAPPDELAINTPCDPRSLIPPRPSGIYLQAAQTSTYGLVTADTYMQSNSIASGSRRSKPVAPHTAGGYSLIFGQR